MKYHMDCGCILQDFELHQTPGHKYTCPRHNGASVIHRYSNCQKCGAEIQNGSRGSVSVKCADCRKKDKPPSKLPKRQVILHFECGCSIDRDLAVKRHIDGGKVFACEQHIEPVEYRVSTCRECGKEFRFYTHSQPPRVCPTCNGENPIKPYENPRLAASIDRADCHLRDECLKKAWKKNEDFLPCLDCERYAPNGIKPQQFSRHDPYEWAHGVAV